MKSLIDPIFAEDGPLSKAFAHYEPREEQIEMAYAVANTQKNRGISLIEAGTGTGKTFAYLIPSILAALKKNEKTIISTHTIALQEQLLEKDVPSLLKLLGVDLEVVLVKGMRNYLCLKRLGETANDGLMNSSQEVRELNFLQQFVMESSEGCRSSFDTPISSSVWDKVSAEHDSCIQSSCPHYKDCYFMQARKKLQDAHILIVNHHLLLTDLLLRKKQETRELGILPKAHHLIIDEAHHLENIAIHTFTKRVDKLSLLKMLTRSFSENALKESAFSQIKNKLSKRTLSYENELLLGVEIPTRKKEVSDSLQAAFLSLEGFCQVRLRAEESQRDKKWVLPKELFPKESPLQEVKKKFDEAGAKIADLCTSLHFLAKECDEINDTVKAPLMELSNLKERLKENAEVMTEFFTTHDDTKRIRSFEEQAISMNHMILDANLDIPKQLREILFSAFESVALCSATLATKKDFSFLRARLGLTSQALGERVITEHLFTSPFDYEKQMIFACADDIPFPHEPGYEESISTYMVDVITETQGGAFLLFTSHEMLRNCHRHMMQDKRMQNHTVLVQGDLPKSTLIREFKEHDDAVLFGTDTFWEGVDIPGNSLRCVVLTKLPFKVPSDPFYQAFCSLLEKEGLNPFIYYALPEACIKFKQGFGRLIRSKQDKGMVLCLDKRLIQKNYGKTFIESLPNCTKLFSSKKKILEGVQKLLATELFSQS